MSGVSMVTPYTLPTIDFVGGETQDLMFNVYFYKNHRPFSLTGCSANFAIVSFTNKLGASTPRSVETATIMTIKSGYLKLLVQNPA